MKTFIKNLILLISIAGNLAAMEVSGEVKNHALATKTKDAKEVLQKVVENEQWPTVLELLKQESYSYETLRWLLKQAWNKSIPFHTNAKIAEFCGKILVHIKKYQPNQDFDLFIFPALTYCQWDIVRDIMHQNTFEFNPKTLEELFRSAIAWDEWEILWLLLTTYQWPLEILNDLDGELKEAQALNDAFTPFRQTIKTWLETIRSQKSSADGKSANVLERPVRISEQIACTLLEELTFAIGHGWLVSKRSLDFILVNPSLKIKCEDLKKLLMQSIQHVSTFLSTSDQEKLEPYVRIVRILISLCKRDFPDQLPVEAEIMCQKADEFLKVEEAFDKVMDNVCNDTFKDIFQEAHVKKEVLDKVTDQICDDTFESILSMALRNMNIKNK